MGDARRRKKIDPNYGKPRVETFDDSQLLGLVETSFCQFMSANKVAFVQQLSYSFCVAQREGFRIPGVLVYPYLDLVEKEKFFFIKGLGIALSAFATDFSVEETTREEAERVWGGGLKDFVQRGEIVPVLLLPRKPELERKVFDYKLISVFANA